MKNRHMRIKECGEFLEEFDGMFADFVRICAVYIDPNIPTACIQFDPLEGTPMALAFNPEFMDGMDDYSLSFLIAHEISHAYLQHGIRGFGLKDKDKANICMDIAVNHYLVDQLKFDRSRVQGQETLCWVDTVLNTAVKPQYNFEFYYNMVDSSFNDGFATLDDHSTLSDMKPEDLPEEVKAAFAESGMPGIGSEAGDLDSWVTILRRKQIKFEDIVKNKIGQICKKKPRELDSWAKLDRRLAFLTDSLPTMDRAQDILKPEKFKLVFFIDVSGSCWEFLERFANFGASIPEDKFDVDFYVFDTKIVPVDLQTEDSKSKIQLAGGGGTSFHPMSKHVTAMEKAPDVVFVLTDGFASPVKVSDPSLWNWFLTDGGSKSAIVNQGKVYKMSQYE